MKRRPDLVASKKSILIKITAVSAFAGIAVFFLTISLFAGIMVFIDVPDIICRIFSGMSAAAGSFSSGYFGAFLRRKNGAVTGAMCSGCVFLTAFTVFLFSGAHAGTGAVFFTMSVCAVFGAIGGIYGVNRHLKGKHYL